ncbi:hypothetical protein D3OALGA1CA_2869 [Olavius algarvensis associated proteobacterium Delta 3]|nr:hypothetical protein D3OALGA1CA_2869 [Olavius algarvensis associated proteobacterium Delta 3]CAB5163050.1 hypothetical protein D3OALGB2SA_5555 [Olavius algarvensis associated proteobacterium Delta 3]
MIVKGYYVKPANFANYPEIGRITEMESLYTQSPVQWIERARF